MEPARSIGRLGFSKWYERRLMEAHAWLLTAPLCAIYVEVSLEGIRTQTNTLAWVGTAAGMFVGGLIVWHGLRRQSIGPACKTYARYEVVREQPKMSVRCRKCSHEWAIDGEKQAITARR